MKKQNKKTNSYHQPSYHALDALLPLQTLNQNTPFSKVLEINPADSKKDN